MKLAIDVVLLPSEDMTEKAIEINQELLKNYENKIILNEQNCLPHISLCMGCVEEEILPEIKKIIEEISKEFTGFNLTAESVEAETIPTGKIVSGIKIKNTEQLKKLHETIMKKIQKFLSYDAETSMFFNPSEVEDISTYWVNNYSKKYGDPDSFHPHITLGFGETNQIDFPVEFKASKLALCHLGNYCTCRKVLLFLNLN